MNERPVATLAFVAILGTACADPPAPASAPSPPATASLDERPEVKIAGCVRRNEGHCLLMARPRPTILGLWIDVDPSARVSVRVDGRQREAQPRKADGGLHLSLTLTLGATLVELDGLDPSWPEPLTLALEWEPRTLERTLAVASRDRAAQTMMLEHALGWRQGDAKLDVLQHLHRLLTSGGKRAEGLRRAEQALVLARELERPRDVADIASVLAFSHISAHEFEAARERIEEIEGTTTSTPEAEVWAHYYAGLLAIFTGDLAGSLRALAHAERWAERLGMTAELISALDYHAIALGELGRVEEAQALMRRGLDLVEEPSISCAIRARAQGNLGWAQLRLVQSGLDDELPWEAFELALAAWEGPCPNPGEAANQRVNLALTALLADEPEEARAWLEQVQAHGAPRWLRPWVDEIDTRANLATGRFEVIPSVLLEPSLHGELGLDWSIAVRRAETLARLGLHEAAAEGYVDAERMLDEAITSVGIDVGKEMFLAARSASMEGLVSELIALGRPREALCRARVARGRALRSVDRAARIAGLDASARARWERAAGTFLAERGRMQRESADDWRYSDTQLVRRRARRDEQHARAMASLDDALVSLMAEPERGECEKLASPSPSPSPGEVLLFVVPVHEDTLILLATDREVTSVRAPAPDPRQAERWAAIALGPLEVQLRDASRIRLAVDGSARVLPWPALPLGDGILLDAAPLVHTLDLPPRSPLAVGNRQALVVADPHQDLPYAREEGTLVRRSLLDAGWAVEHRQGAQASRQAVATALTNATLLHYAGHGVHRGEDGWGAALMLHDGELGVADLLALPRVPSTVVLAGCDTGSGSGSAWAGGINIGRAFVLAGSEQVIVAEGSIDDALARRVSEAMAAHIAATPRPDLASALQTVQQEIRREDPDAQWWRLQVLAP